MSRGESLIRTLRRKLFGNEETERTENRYFGKPKELFGVGSQDSISIVYIGNGAKENYYQEIINSNQLDGKAYSGMGGFYNECAVIYVGANEDGKIDVTVMEAFRHRSEEAIFSGFTLRKKENGKWVWYLADGSWNGECSKEKKKLFYKNDELPEVEKSAKYPVYVLTAQWTDKNRRSMNCGYKMFRNKVMAHALGDPDGNKYHNTIRALEHSIDHGFRYFEADLSLTEDDRVVLCHGWSKQDCKRIGIPYDPAYEHMTYDMTRQLKIHGDPITDGRELYEYIKKLPEDHCFEIDMHSRQPDRHAVFVRQLVRDFQYDEAVLERLLMQIYYFSMFKAMDSSYRFEVYQFSLVGGIERLDSVIQRCLDYGICAIALRAVEASKEVIDKCKFAGLNVLAFSVFEDVTFAKTLLANGVDTICTNGITEEQVREHDTFMEPRPYYLGIPKSAVKDPTELEKRFDIDTEEDSFVYIRVSNSVPNTHIPELLEPESDDSKQFQGWSLRRSLEGTKWYCRDGVFRSASKIKAKKEQYEIFFSSGDELPVFPVKEYEKLRLIAKWIRNPK